MIEKRGNSEEFVRNSGSSVKRRVSFLLAGLFLGITGFVGSILLLNYYSAKEHSLFFEEQKERLYTSRDRPSAAAVSWIVRNKLKHADEKFLSGTISPALTEVGGPVYVALRSGGRHLGEAWHERGTWKENIEEALSKAHGIVQENKKEEIDSVELNLTFGYKKVDIMKRTAFLSDLHRGILGIELKYGKRRVLYAPTKMIAENLSFLDILREFKETYRINFSKPAKKNIPLKARVFSADQIIIDLNHSNRNVKMHRGNSLIGPTEVTHSKVIKLTDSLGSWLIKQVGQDGQMPHEYFPSKDSYSSTNNVIRQFMASICLGRLASYYNKKELRELSYKNIRYNLGAFYTSEDSLGYIEYNNKKKLGAASVAAITLLEHPWAETFQSTLESLTSLIDHLWQEDGSFKTFYKSNRNDNQSFYPGEALLFWAMRYRRERNAELLKKFMKSFEFYRRWYYKHRHPSFIPWHTQAYYLMWRHTKDPALAEFVFEMNDWLLEMQQWEKVLYEDGKGRFYNPEKPLFGSPHAASTGIYLESLIDAFKLAKELKDFHRMEAYRRGILRGLRSVMQLQFVDGFDMFYISNKERVRGAVRTTVYDNVVRIDNVQQNLMAVLKILKVFSAEDYSNSPLM